MQLKSGHSKLKEELEALTRNLNVAQCKIESQSSEISEVRALLNSDSKFKELEATIQKLSALIVNKKVSIDFADQLQT